MPVEQKKAFTVSTPAAAPQQLKSINTGRDKATVENHEIWVNTIDCNYNALTWIFSLLSFHEVYSTIGNYLALLEIHVTEEHFLSKWFHKEPSTSEEPFCVTQASLCWKTVLQIIKR